MSIENEVEFHSKLVELIRSRPWAPAVRSEVVKIADFLRERCKSLEEAVVLLTSAAELNGGRLTFRRIQEAASGAKVKPRSTPCPLCRDHPGWRYSLFVAEYEDGRLARVRRVTEPISPDELDVEIGKKYHFWAVETCLCNPASAESAEES